MTVQDPRIKPVAIRSPRGARRTEIDWADGHKGIYPHDILRGYCPCAGCQGHTGDIRYIEPRDDQQQLDELSPVGGYALSLKWSDGHESGIYSYRYLRSLCQCPSCTATGAEARGPLPRR